MKSEGVRGDGNGNTPPVKAPQGLPGGPKMNESLDLEGVRGCWELVVVAVVSGLRDDEEIET